MIDVSSRSRPVDCWQDVEMKEEATVTLNFNTYPIEFLNYIKTIIDLH